MAHHREFIDPTSQSEQFTATSAADPPTYDFLQLPQNPLAQFHDMHEVEGSQNVLFRGIKLLIYNIASLVKEVLTLFGFLQVVGHTQPLHPSNFMELQKWHLQQFWQQQMLELGNLAGEYQ